MNVQLTRAEASAVIEALTDYVANLPLGDRAASLRMKERLIRRTHGGADPMLTGDEPEILASAMAYAAELDGERFKGLKPIAQRLLAGLGEDEAAHSPVSRQ